MAALACQPGLAEDGERAGVPPAAELPVSPAGATSGGRRSRPLPRQAAEAEREGQRPADTSEKSSCARPGCYELFVPARPLSASAILFVLVP